MCASIPLTGGFPGSSDGRAHLQRRRLRFSPWVEKIPCRREWQPTPGFLVSLMTQTVNNLSAMQEWQVQFLGQEDPLKKGMATQSRILEWRIPWTEEAGGLQSMGSESDTTE